MNQIRLGKDGPFVSAIGQGTWGLGGRFTAETSEDASAIEAIRMGLDLGLTFIDTAEAYGAGHTETLVGQAVRGRRSEAFIATKVSPENLRAYDVAQAAEGSLKRLKTDYIDLYQIHWPNPSIPVEETLTALERLVEQGKVRFIGLSNFSCRGLDDAFTCAVRAPVALQVEYNLFDRTVERDLLPSCRRNGVTLIAYSPLDQGKSLRRREPDDVLTAIAEKHGRTAAQVILNWLALVQGVLPIPKAGNTAHLKENAAALTFSLDETDLAAIDGAFTPEPQAIPAAQIHADRNGLDCFVPGPAELARQIVGGETIKPVRVVASAEDPSRFDLVEGKLRYWAWIEAFGAENPVPALIRQPA
ncbi:MAG: aldo/keto reductase [Sedimentisphaerales bacterium]|nr:aldo/keto reductase [Sedimentisphaerales bacterium]